MTYQFAQHSPSNLRKRTDKYLEPENLEGIIDQCIAQEDMLQKYKVTVSDEEISQERSKTGNSLSLGDAVEIILRKKLSRYKSLAYWEKINKPRGMRFENAYYDIDSGVTHYYYKLGVEEELTDEEALEAL